MPIVEIEIPSRPLNSVPEIPSRITHLGSSVTLCADGKEEIIFDMSAKCAIGEVLALVFGVTCDPTDDWEDSPVEDEPIVLLRTRIVWGAGNAQFEAYADIREGTILFLPAETIRVYARMFTVRAFDSTNQGPCPKPRRVSAAVTYGGGAVRDAGTLTHVVDLPRQPLAYPGNDNPDPILLDRVRVPPFARGFSLVPLDGETLTVRVRGGGGNVLATYTAAGPIVTPNAFPLFNGAKWLEVSVAETSETMRGFIIFGLDL